MKIEFYPAINGFGASFVPFPLFNVKTTVMPNYKIQFENNKVTSCKETKEEAQGSWEEYDGRVVSAIVTAGSEEEAKEKAQHIIEDYPGRHSSVTHG